jgi:histone-lysine N-methyltransferase SETMAR
MLSDEMKDERVRISRELLERFEKEGEDFLKKFITGDETWVHHYDPENKRQSMEYGHKKSPQPKKFQNRGLGGKSCRLFFGIRNVLFLQNFLKKKQQ